MNRLTRAKATGQLQVCNFCRGITEPILTEDPEEILAYKCESCGSIGTLKQDDQGGYYLHWTIPSNHTEESKGVHDLLIEYTIEQMQQLIEEAEAKTGNSEYARQICNAALRKRGDKPIF